MENSTKIKRKRQRMSTPKKTEKQCHNPWKEECISENIKLYIQLKKEDQPLPICHSCWNQIADSNREWGPEQIKEMEDFEERKRSSSTVE